MLLVFVFVTGENYKPHRLWTYTIRWKSI